MVPEEASVTLSWVKFSGRSTRTSLACFIFLGQQFSFCLFTLYLGFSPINLRSFRNCFYRPQEFFISRDSCRTNTVRLYNTWVLGRGVPVLFKVFIQNGSQQHLRPSWKLSFPQSFKWNTLTILVSIWKRKIILYLFGQHQKIWTHEQHMSCIVSQGLGRK